jgi:hypothetical protein
MVCEDRKLGSLRLTIYPLSATLGQVTASFHHKAWFVKHIDTHHVKVATQNHVRIGVPMLYGAPRCLKYGGKRTAGRICGSVPAPCGCQEPHQRRNGGPARPSGMA